MKKNIYFRYDGDKGHIVLWINGEPVESMFEDEWENVIEAWEKFWQKELMKNIKKVLK